MSWLLATSALAGEWPAWRGPRGDGVSEETNVPVRWSSSENVAWKTAIPGWGHSSPIIWGDRVFVTTYVEQGGRRVLLCLDRLTGKLLWEKTVLTAKPEKKNNLNSYASGTPATDGKRVWVTFLQAPDTVGVSYVPSPIAHGNHFFVVSDRGLASCFEAKTGKRMWQQKLGRHHSASAVAAGGNIYFLDDDGKMFVLKAGPKFELIAKNELGEECYASPAISHGRFFIRTLGNLYCIGTP
jgi:outer membrane protein assembly factor BamB